MSYRRHKMMVQKKDINYMYLTALEDGTFTFTIQEGLSTTDFTSVSYSLDKKHWTTLTNDGVSEVSTTTPTIETGETVYVKGIANRWSDGDKRAVVLSTGQYNVGGNILSLLFGDDCDKKINEDLSDTKYEHLFERVFQYRYVIDASNLLFPLGEIPNSAFKCMFYNSNIVIAPSILPGNVNVGSHQSMFEGCASLTTMPDMSAMAAPEVQTRQNCFAGMFKGCTSLKYFTPIPYINTGKSGSDGQFLEMFYGCTSLEDTPIKEIRGYNGTNLYDAARTGYNMFYQCSKLKTAPSLPVDNIKSYEYRNMFYQCSKLSYIKMLCLTKNNTALQNWVNGVASSGIFVKHINATWTDSGANGVPTGWTVIYYNPSTDKYYLSDKTTECDDHGNVIN